MLAKARYIVLLAVLFGILASYSVYRYLLRYDTMVEAKEIVTEPVLVADRELTAGQEISADDLKLSEWPVEIVPPEHFTSIDEVVGRISRYPLGVGEPVVESRLAPPGALQGLAATIPPGYRAMTVAVNMVSSVSGFVLPGSHVDVLVSMRPAGKTGSWARFFVPNMVSPSPRLKPSPAGIDYHGFTPAGFFPTIPLQGPFLRTVFSFLLSAAHGFPQANLHDLTFCKVLQFNTFHPFILEGRPGNQAHELAF